MVINERINNNMQLKKRKSAFSMVELMLLLLISSLIIAAMVPLVTKKHLKVPSVASHGTYMCYYKNGKLHETRWSGKLTQKKVFDRDALGNCVFDPPKKATYFQISAVGGGGGGGDAGYNGGAPSPTIDPVTTVSPFGLTEETATTLGFKDETKTSNQFQEAIQATGALWVYARGAASGSGGDIGYMNWPGTYHNGPCDAWGPCCSSSCCKKSATIGEGATKTTCYPIIKGTGSGTGSASSGTSLFRQILAKFSIGHKIANYIKGHITGAATSSTPCGTKYTWSTEEPIVEEYISGYEQECHQKCTAGTESYQISPARDWTETYDCNCQTTTKCMGGGNGDSQASSSNGNLCTTVTTCDTCTRNRHEDAKYGTRCKAALENVCVDVPKYSQKVTGYNTVGHSQGSLSDCTGTAGVDYECSTTAGNPGFVCLECGTTCTHYIQLENDFVYKTASGGNGASGATCTSNSVAAGTKLLNLLWNPVAKAGDDGPDGSSYDTHSNGMPFATQLQADSGRISCISGFAESCSGDLSFSEANITENNSIIHKTKAFSASKGGEGARRDVGPAMETTRWRTIPATDVITYTPSSGTAGVCESDGGYESSSNTACGSGQTGYCLTRRKASNPNQLETVANDDAVYAYKREYDKNYLTKGEPGNAGEFNTVIVRSLASVDRTIHIGRGGSPATLNLGQAGASGSATYMGASFETAIAKAKGGAGGSGMLNDVYPSQLPKFNQKAWQIEKLCYKGTGRTASETSTLNTLLTEKGLSSCPTTYQYIKIAGGDTGSTPSRTSVGGIFNFVLSAFNNDSVLDSLLGIAGRGGKGGGVIHKCWAGPDMIWFNETYLSGPSVNRETVNDSGCYADFENIVAGPGSDGALIIRW